MLLTIDGHEREFIPLRTFREAHDLPPDFAVSRFTPKDYAGLGRIDTAGAALNSLRAAVLAAVPEKPSPTDLLAVVPRLVEVFRQKLTEINPQVGLREAEVDFAIAGFGDVLSAFAYAVAGARLSGSETPAFQSVYTDWLNNSLRVFSEVYDYSHGGQTWRVRVVAHAYGRMGLLVQTPGAEYAVYDPVLACPAEGFMAALLGEVAGRLLV